MSVEAIMKLKHQIVFVLTVVAFGSFTSFSQERDQETEIYFDSLWSVWQDETRLDSLRLSALGLYTWQQYVFVKPDSAIYYGQLEHDFAQKVNSKIHIAEAYKTQGTAHWVKGEYIKSLEFFKKELVIDQELGDKAQIAATLNKFGIVYSDLGNNVKALDYLERSLELREEIGDKGQIAYTLNSLGDVCYDQGNTRKAIEYFERRLEIRKEIDSTNTSLSLNNLGKCYAKQGNYDLALEYFYKGLRMSERSGDIRNQALNASNIGKALKDKGALNEAMTYLKKGLAIKEQIGSLPLIAETLSDIGALYNAQMLFSKGIETCERSYKTSLELGDINKQKIACECLYNGYKGLNNGNKALAYHEKMLLLNDSLKSEETARKIQQMEFAEVVLKDSIAKAEIDREIAVAHQKEVQKKNQTRNILIGIGAFILFLSLILYNRLKFVRKTQATLQVEKDRSENLLLNILPEEIAQELKEHGKAKAKDFEMVSILFTDFKSFTQNAAKLSAQELVKEINTCFEAFDGIIEKYGIEKIKTIGDAYMAAGGLPVPSDESVKNTVLAALEMQAFISDRIITKRAKDAVPFEMRLGIHTGPVVAGIVGVKKFQYDVWGDTVNTASRIESTGEIGRVNISHSTYEFIKEEPQFTFAPRGKIEVKGKESIAMYFVSKSSKHIV